MRRVVFEAGGERVAVDAEDGEAVLGAARKVGLYIETPCGGAGICGKCRSRINGKSALLCQTRVTENALVILPPSAAASPSAAPAHAAASPSAAPAHAAASPSAAPAHVSHDANYAAAAQTVAAQPANGAKAAPRCLGVACDIGTTTLALSLVDMETGKSLAAETRLNPQTQYAQDVLGRIQFAAAESGYQTLRRALAETLRDMAGSLCEKTQTSRGDIREAVYSGNPTMIYIAAGLNPAPLGTYPFTLEFAGGVCIPAQEIAPGTEIYLPPMVSAYIGSDITSGILSERLEKKRGNTLFIDIGTNGEMALSQNGRLAAAATAAGPAFEGMNITCGTRAKDGALEYFKIEGAQCKFRAIGGAALTGICGSGLLDLVGELVREGAILPSGRFADKPPPVLAKYFREAENGGKAFFLNDEVSLTQKDVREVQLAKGAIRSGVEMLLSHFGLVPSDLEEVIIAGSFGEHLREESLLSIGLLPVETAGKVRFAGNTSLHGAEEFLLDKQIREEMRRLVTTIDTVDLAGSPAFQETFVRALGF